MEKILSLHFSQGCHFALESPELHSPVQKPLATWISVEYLRVLRCDVNVEDVPDFGT